MSATLITVTGSWQDPAGTPATGWVALSLMEPRQVHAEDPSFVTAKRTVVDLVDGAATWQVVASDDPQWADGPRMYRVEEHLSLSARADVEWFCYLDGPGPVDLASVAVLDPVECGVTVPTQDHGAMAGLGGNDHPQYSLTDHVHDPGGDHDHTPLNDTLYSSLGHSHAPTPDTNWAWTDSLTGDPGEGYVGADAPLWQDVTQVRINHVDGDGMNVPDLPEAVNPGDTLTLTNEDTREVGIYAINAVTDQGLWFLLTVTYDRGGGGNPLPDAAMRIGITLQSAAPHDHDDRYYTETESGTLFAAEGHDHDAAYSPTGHNHDVAYDAAGTAQGLVDTHEATTGQDFHAYGWVGTQAEFDGLGSYEATRVYYVVG